MRKGLLASALLKGGADPNCGDEAGRTPLHYAMMYLHPLPLRYGGHVEEMVKREVLWSTSPIILDSSRAELHWRTAPAGLSLFVGKCSGNWNVRPSKQTVPQVRIHHIKQITLGVLCFRFCFVLAYPRVGSNLEAARKLSWNGPFFLIYILLVKLSWWRE
jgi:hypothetical protein